MILGRPTPVANTGVMRSELTVLEPPLPFLASDGLERLLEVASELDITLLVD